MAHCSRKVQDFSCAPTCVRTHLRATSMHSAAAAMLGSSVAMWAYVDYMSASNQGESAGSKYTADPWLEQLSHKKPPSS